MFCQIYKTSIKNLLRSLTFWVVFLLLIVVTLYSEGVDGHYGYNSSGTLIMDTDPIFVLDFRTYYITVHNVGVATVMLYMMPLFSVISTVLILARNHGDDFYEIEKAAGLSPLKYTLGKISAILTVNFIVVTLAVSIGFHFYIFSRGGVPYMGLWYYIGDSTMRILRIILFLFMPSIIMYVGITYVVGSLLKNSLGAAIVSIGYVIAYYIMSYPLRFRIPELYFDYFSPLPRKLSGYLYAYDTYAFEGYSELNGISFEKAAVCFTLLVTTGVICILISYLLTRKREK